MIEFVLVGDDPIVCKTTSNGSTTETTTSISAAMSLGLSREFLVLAESGRVRFFIDEVLVATHTTDVPQTPMNPFLSLNSTATDGKGANVSGKLDFERF